jgi:hypothetical protein
MQKRARARAWAGYAMLTHVLARKGATSRMLLLYHQLGHLPDEAEIMAELDRLT